MKDHFNDAHEELFDVPYNNEGIPILKMKIRMSLNILNLAMTPGPNNITIEIINDEHNI